MRRGEKRLTSKRSPGSYGGSYGDRPRKTMSAQTQHPAWRDGKFLVLPRALPVAPDRCIFTNEPVFTHSKITKHLSWGSNGPSHWLPMKIQLLWSIKDMKIVPVTFGVSHKVRVGRYLALATSAICIVVGVSLFVQGLQKGVPPPMTYVGGGAALIAISLTLLANTYLIIDIVAMNEEFIWLRGAKSRFLDSLPSFRESS